MADFKRHVICSSATGVVGGGTAYACGVPLATCLVSAGLCGLAGMLPDVDSDSSRSFKTCLHIAAVIGAMLTIQGGRMLRIEHDWVIFAASCVFFFILNVVGSTIKKLTVHRGMIHSLPAAIIAGQFMYLVSEGDTKARIVKALGLFAGFLSHLILDEVYSFDSMGKEFKIKKSFGTAIKMIDYKHTYVTATFYAAVLLLSSIIANESTLLEELKSRNLVAERAQPEQPQKEIRTTVHQQPTSYEPLEAASVNLRPQIGSHSGYAENEIFRRRRRQKESTEIVTPSPVDRPMLFRTFASNAAEPPPLVEEAPRPERIRLTPIFRNSAPAPIALSQ